MQDRRTVRRQKIENYGKDVLNAREKSEMERRTVSTTQKKSEITISRTVQPAKPQNAPQNEPRRQQGIQKRRAKRPTEPHERQGIQKTAGKRQSRSVVSRRLPIERNRFLRNPVGNRSGL